MEGLVFTVSLLSILVTVGGLFAWMVSRASAPELEEQSPHSSELPH